MEGLEEQWKKACADYNDAAAHKERLYEEISDVITKASFQEWKTKHKLGAIVAIEFETTTHNHSKNKNASGRVCIKDGQIISVRWLEDQFYFDVGGREYIPGFYSGVSAWRNKRTRNLEEALLPDVIRVKDVLEDLDAIATEKRAKFSF